MFPSLKPPTIVLMAGLQGTGKTTAAAVGLRLQAESQLLNGGNRRLSPSSN